jgi:hypothetical protein
LVELVETGADEADRRRWLRRSLCDRLETTATNMPNPARKLLEEIPESLVE